MGKKMLCVNVFIIDVNKGWFAMKVAPMLTLSMFTMMWLMWSLRTAFQMLNPKLPAKAQVEEVMSQTAAGLQHRPRGFKWWQKSLNA